MADAIDHHGAKASFVLDCSMVLSWCFLDERSPSSAFILERLKKAQAIVPAIWPYEVRNALLVGERRKRSTSEDTEGWLQFLDELPITIESEFAKRAKTDVLILARRFAISVYDSSYMELALRLGIPLATLDQSLRKAAKKAGIALL